MTRAPHPPGCRAGEDFDTTTINMNIPLLVMRPFLTVVFKIILPKSRPKYFYQGPPFSSPLSFSLFLTNCLW